MLFQKLKRVFLCFFTLFLFSFFAFFFIFYYYGRDLPSELTLLDYSPPTTTRIFSSENELIEEYAIEHRTLAKFNEIPPIIKGAFMIAEDREFYSHSGISFQSLIRAIIENTAKKSWDKRPVGGSTITQQVAKNLLVGKAKKMSRKIREAIMAFRIEAAIPKDKIFEIYLNQLYLGKGCYGIVEACNYYFNKKLEEITPHEAAFIAAIPNAPSAYVNMKNSPKLLMKRNYILHQLHDMGYISDHQLQKSILMPIKTNQRKRKLFAPYFSDEIFKIFSRQISKSFFFRCGYSIKTTMDKRIQKSAQKALEDGLIEYTKKTPWRGVIGNINDEKVKSLNEIDKALPMTINKISSCVVKKIERYELFCETSDERKILIPLSDEFYPEAKFKKGDILLCRFHEKKRIYELYQPPEVTGGIVVMNPQNGDILAMSGGFSFDISSFNCVTQAQRQPGSIIKPFIYAAAIRAGKTEHDTIEDKPITIKLSNGESYTPHNYEGKHHGKISLRDGLAHSMNLLTVNLAVEIGIKPIAKLLNSLNLTKSKIPISAILGSVEVTPLQILTAFSSFFNEGKMVYPRFVTDITQIDQKYSVEIFKEMLCKTKHKQVMEKETAEIVKNMLHDVVKYGTANSISGLEKKFGLEIFGKTGTTNNFKDAWFIGAVKNNLKTYLVCVFVGYSLPKSLGDHQSGAKVALPIFSNFIKNFFNKEVGALKRGYRF
ncbi:MAG: transglycosylase domain-containing protein [Holosporales bacterium]|jgi:penicillin-binding protein 1A|nr:transglycosylase domain-containing protein [Holosporales bacterium]